ncbi:MAG TPA: hypothetical protein VFE16_10320 [Candidatus Cybelea sp.]|jgi:DNA-binding beta-propeller fold protein YncE|nr:hypothetical protein [Candidatus Cybelea sp.]
MLPEAKGEDLMYLVTDVDFAYVVSYPKGKSVGQLTFAAENGSGVCSDSKGHIFVTAYGYQPAHGYIYEFKHAGTKPIATIDDGSNIPTSCAIDPASGNLAVTNDAATASHGGNVAIYTEARGAPTTYSDSSFISYAGVTFDDNGNLFVIGRGHTPFAFAELQDGGSALIDILIGQQIYGTHIQWDGTDLAITERAANNRSHPVVYRVNVSGSIGTVVGTTTFNIRGPSSGDVSWIQGKTITMDDRLTKLAFWPYPSGGNVQRAVGSFDCGHTGLTISKPLSH